MPTTARDIARAALMEIGVLAQGEDPNASMGDDALVALNNLIDSWAAERLQIYTVTRTTWTIAAATSTYTVGTGATINVARPVFVSQVAYIDSSLGTPTYEFQLGALTDDAYAQINIKDLANTYPQCFYYKQTLNSNGFAQMILWPVPSSTTLTGVMYAPQACPELATLDTNILLLTGYRRMLIKNLALELCPSYSRQVDPALVNQAMESKAIVKRGNFKLQDLVIDQGALPQGSYHRWGYGYNIYQG